MAKQKYRTYSDTPGMIQACLTCPTKDCAGYDGTMCQRLKEVRRRETEMTLNEYQELALRTSNTVQKKTRITNGAMGLCGEAGEVIDIVKKWQFQGHELDEDHLAEEMGDCMWYLSELAKGLGVTLEKIAQKNIEKLKKRYPDGFDAERSKNREENDE